MTCDEYRQLLNASLDASSEPPTSDEVRQHAATCAGCRAYTEFFLRLDRQLKAIPRVAVPPELLEAIRSIGKRASAAPPELSWKPELQRAAVLVVPALIASILGFHLSGPAQIVIEFAIMLAGFTALAISLLRQRILGTASE